MEYGQLRPTLYVIYIGIPVKHAIENIVILVCV